MNVGITAISSIILVLASVLVGIKIAKILEEKR